MALDKLQREVEKLTLEIKTLKRPYIAQPTTWFTVVGLLLSVFVNFSQCSDSRSTERLAKIDKAQAELDVRLLTIQKDSIQKQIEILEQQKELAKTDLDNVQARLSETQKKIDQFLTTSPNLTPSQAKEIGSVQESLSRIKAVNKNASQNFSSSTTSSTQLLSKNLEAARQKEREGFQYLINGDYANAARSFQASEDSYNGYHWVYELARLMRENKNTPQENSAKRAEIINTVLEKYSKGAPQDLIEQLKKSL